MIKKGDEDWETRDAVKGGTEPRPPESLGQISSERDFVSKVNKKQAVGNLLDYSVEVTGYVDHIGNEGHRYTTYEILVAKRGKVQADEEKCWAVSKRYSDFVALRDSLRGMYIEVDSFDFPNKSKFNTHATWTKERRKRGFHDYMNLITSLPSCPTSVIKFLGINHVGNDDACTTKQEQEDPGGSASISTPGEAPKAWRRPTFPPLAEANEKTTSGDKTRGSKAFRVWDSADSLLRDSCGTVVLAVMVVVVCVAVTIAVLWRISGIAGLMTLFGGITACLVLQMQSSRYFIR